MSSFFIKLFSSWLFVLVVIFSTTTMHSQAAETYCGRKLGNTLDLICEFGFGTKLKKSVKLEPNDYYSDTDEDMPFSFEKFPFLAKFQENSLAKTRRRRYGGIANECCDKPCTMDELRSFCRNNGK
ncbi:bombyxin B-9-like [Episyrphus balteatus]|uniref:bombyxin B-9-like n=1 Tax=Episyrphus balteatus TaxID=286459 RepID=UPI0024860A62|nr:bombyxin B-9-like [Episyrphus balteatus]